ncbi:MAG: hypothetical protein JWM91_4176 [Rhodospirillales bacterium]|nr:hypothetical protein [Rhodospirillales bacterium]
MALPLVLTSLADKRARYVAEMDHHQKRVDAAVDAIAKIDAVIALWDEKPDLTAVRRRYREHGEDFKWREIARTVIAILRDAPAGLTTAEVQHVIAERKGISGIEELRRLSKRVTTALNDKRRDGILVKDGKRDGRFVFRIAQDGEGVRCPKRLAATEQRNAERAQRRLERRSGDERRRGPSRSAAQVHRPCAVIPQPWQRATVSFPVPE